MREGESLDERLRKELLRSELKERNKLSNGQNPMTNSLDLHLLEKHYRSAQQTSSAALLFMAVEYQMLRAIQMKIITFL